MCGSGREFLSNVLEGLGGPPGCRGVVESPSRMSENGRDAFPDVREACRMSGSDRESLTYVMEALSDVQEWSGGPPRCLGVVGRPC